MTVTPAHRGPSPSSTRLAGNTPRQLALFGLTVLAGALWAARAHLVGTQFVFLWWNLFLAWVPWCLSLRLERLESAWVFWPLALVWLVFFPNAPYLLTDLVHLKHRPPVPLWFDVLFLASFAWAGCAIGWDSLWRMHRAWSTRLGAAPATGMVVLSVVLCGVGVFLGRFERLNSWDLATDPLAVLSTAVELLTTPRALVFSTAFAAFVGAGYVFFGAAGKTAP